MTSIKEKLEEVKEIIEQIMKKAKLPPIAVSLADEGEKGLHLNVGDFLVITFGNVSGEIYEGKEENSGVYLGSENTTQNYQGFTLLMVLDVPCIGDAYVGWEVPLTFKDYDEIISSPRSDLIALEAVRTYFHQNLNEAINSIQLERLKK
jgi:hypothetical protein